MYQKKRMKMARKDAAHRDLVKIFKSRQVCDWLAKWIIMLRFMDQRLLRIFRRSNVGLVTFYNSRDTSVVKLFHVVFQLKRFSSLTEAIETVSKLVDCVRKLQNDVHIDTFPTRTHITTINQHSSVSHAFSVPNWWEMCGVVIVLTFLLLSPKCL